MEFIYNLSAAIIVIGVLFLPLSRIRALGIDTSKLDIVKLYEPYVTYVTLAALVVFIVITVLDLA
ncbi:MAG: hypothetical protein E6790_08640 [Veillonella sp.]|uniref:hypothetical protein n=1 Tax=Veillonella sp. TaxID=1926307 RepID=UPI0028FE9ED4|nr:hypothetical protein [Veillonella sp.]MDU1827524.1 hypothetical protein [Veillonella sp.]